MWNEYNLACWHRFPPSWSVSLGSKLNKIAGTGRSCDMWHCDNDEMIIVKLDHFWQPSVQSSSVGINIKTFHDFIHPLPVIIDDSCRVEHNMITPAVSCSTAPPPWLGLTAVCLFVVFFSAFGLLTESYNWHWLQQPPPAYPGQCPYITPILIRAVHTNITITDLIYIFLVYILWSFLK